MKRRLRESIRALFAWFDDPQLALILAAALLFLLLVDWYVETIGAR